MQYSTPSIQLKIKNKFHLNFSAPVPCRRGKPLLCMGTTALTSSHPPNIKIHVHNNKFKPLATTTTQTLMQRLFHQIIKIINENTEVVLTPMAGSENVSYITSGLFTSLYQHIQGNYKMYKEREYSLVNPIFSTEAATLSPCLQANTNSRHTKKSHPEKIFCIYYLTKLQNERIKLVQYFFSPLWFFLYFSPFFLNNNNKQLT